MTNDGKQDWQTLTDCCPNCGAPDDASARIRELEDKMRAYEQYVTNLYDVDVSRVAAGTHVVVPVEMNANMRSKAHEAYCDALTNRDSVSIAELIDVSFAAAIKAAQEGDNG